MRLVVQVAALVSVAMISAASSAQATGSIQGKVATETGAPLSGALVRCDPSDGRPSARALRTVYTDKRGRFTFDGLAFGTYKLFAMKESDGYANTAFSFYADRPFPTVALSTNVQSAEVLLSIGPPAGVLFGEAHDAATGANLNASFLLRRVQDPESWISLSQPANYRILIPHSADISLEVSAPGYKTLYYGGSSDPLKRAPIRLESGKKMKLDVQLEPEVRPLERQ